MVSQEQLSRRWKESPDFIGAWIGKEAWNGQHHARVMKHGNGWCASVVVGYEGSTYLFEDTFRTMKEAKLATYHLMKTHD